MYAVCRRQPFTSDMSMSAHTYVHQTIYIVCLCINMYIRACMMSVGVKDGHKTRSTVYVGVLACRPYILSILELNMYIRPDLNVGAKCIH